MLRSLLVVTLLSGVAVAQPVTKKPVATKHAKPAAPECADLAAREAKVAEREAAVAKREAELQQRDAADAARLRRLREILSPIATDLQ